MNFKVKIKSSAVSRPKAQPDLKKAFNEINAFHRRELMNYMETLKSNLLLQYDYSFQGTKEKLKEFSYELQQFEKNFK
ncbi:MAG: hypothetical protein HY547_09995, partial [Elusimicrobia bacterium]|nr:hypothetical protein [Elusimicrobiota bacterium]